MGRLKKTIFENRNIKPKLYATYVDVIFLKVDYKEQLIKIKKTMERRSSLKFTYELSFSKKLPFLDVPLNKKSNLIKTTVYRKKPIKNNA